MKSEIQSTENLSKRPFMTLERKEAWTGRLFLLPWFLGFVFLFAIPMGQTIYYSFQDISISTTGFIFKNVGLNNFEKAFLVDPDFARNVTESVVGLIIDVPIIIILSLLIAVIIKDNFRGRTIVRAIFFLPVIIASGVIISMLRTNIFAEGGNEAASLINMDFLGDTLNSIGIPIAVSGFVVSLVERIFDLVWKSGVQILLFLAALNTISPSSYEAANMEGATGWEIFWKITFPMITPMILVSVVYTIIDSFTDYGNQVMQQVFKTMQNGNFGQSAAFALIYFAIIMALLGVVSYLLSKIIFYQVD